MTADPPKLNRNRRSPQILAMMLIGAGLMLLSVVAWLMLPNPGLSSDAAGYDSAVPYAVEFPAPELQLVNLDGEAVSLADFKGQFVLVNNWAIWCPPCKAEMPVLQAYYDEHRQQDFTIVGIEAGESPKGVAEFVEQRKLTFPIWPDPMQFSMQTFKATILPNSYLVDRSGVVRLAWTGAISREMLEKYVTPILEE